MEEERDKMKQEQQQQSMLAAEQQMERGRDREIKSRGSSRGSDGSKVSKSNSRSRSTSRSHSRNKSVDSGGGVVASGVDDEAVITTKDRVATSAASARIPTSSPSSSMKKLSLTVHTDLYSRPSTQDNTIRSMSATKSASLHYGEQSEENTVGGGGGGSSGSAGEVKDTNKIFTPKSILRTSSAFGGSRAEYTAMTQTRSSSPNRHSPSHPQPGLSALPRADSPSQYAPFSAPRYIPSSPSVMQFSPVRNNPGRNSPNRPRSDSGGYGAINIEDWGMGSPGSVGDLFSLYEGREGDGEEEILEELENKRATDDDRQNLSVFWLQMISTGTNERFQLFIPVIYLVIMIEIYTRSIK